MLSGYLKLKLAEICLDYPKYWADAICLAKNIEICRTAGDAKVSDSVLTSDQFGQMYLLSAPLRVHLPKKIADQVLEEFGAEFIQEDGNSSWARGYIRVRYIG